MQEEKQKRETLVVIDEKNPQVVHNYYDSWGWRPLGGCITRVLQFVTGTIVSALFFVYFVLFGGEFQVVVREDCIVVTTGSGIIDVNTCESELIIPDP